MLLPVFDDAVPPLPWFEELDVLLLGFEELAVVLPWLDAVELPFAVVVPFAAPLPPTTTPVGGSPVHPFAAAMSTAPSTANELSRPRSFDTEEVMCFMS